MRNWIIECYCNEVKRGVSFEEQTIDTKTLELCLPAS